MDDSRRTRAGAEFLQSFAAALRAAQLYSPGHPIITRNIAGLEAATRALLAGASAVTFGVVGQEIVIGDLPVAGVDAYVDLARRLKKAGIERVTIQRSVEGEEVAALVGALASSDLLPTESPFELPACPHIRVGRVEVEKRVETTTADMATLRKMYAEAVSTAETVWESARMDSKPDVPAARTAVDGLAQAVAQNRPALLALTALRNYDNYTFTHMINVSILAMAQGRALGIDGPLLREIGMGALLHDIGKVRIPKDILNKPDKLTEAEFTIIKRHPLDGAEMLRRTPDMPSLAPIVAFEHHLRAGSAGYPEGVVRTTLNLATELASIADVYDAMRSKRIYQQSFPTDRILEVLEHGRTGGFDQHLVRRFAQLLGIYPVGNLVRLNTGDVAVVVRVHAPDPYRPRVRVLFDRDGKRRDRAYDCNLWESESGRDCPTSIVAPLDPADYGIDPLALM
jgi:putative nucleotidyltransferase with HDIG domain